MARVSSSTRAWMSSGTRIGGPAGRGSGPIVAAMEAQWGQSVATPPSCAPAYLDNNHRATACTPMTNMMAPVRDPWHQAQEPVEPALAFLLVEAFEVGLQLLLGRPLEQGVEPRAFLDPDPLSASRTTTKKNSARNSRPVTTELVKVVAKMITNSVEMPLYRP